MIGIAHFFNVRWLIWTRSYRSWVSGVMSPEFRVVAQNSELNTHLPLLHQEDLAGADDGVAQVVRIH